MIAIFGTDARRCAPTSRGAVRARSPAPLPYPNQRSTLASPKSAINARVAINVRVAAARLLPGPSSAHRRATSPFVPIGRCGRRLPPPRTRFGSCAPPADRRPRAKRAVARPMIASFGTDAKRCAPTSRGAVRARSPAPLPYPSQQSTPASRSMPRVAAGRRLPGPSSAHRRGHLRLLCPLGGVEGGYLRRVRGSAAASPPVDRRPRAKRAVPGPMIASFGTGAKRCAPTSRGAVRARSPAPLPYPSQRSTPVSRSTPASLPPASSNRPARTDVATSPFVPFGRCGRQSPPPYAHIWRCGASSPSPFVRVWRSAPRHPRLLCPLGGA